MQRNHKHIVGQFYHVFTRGVDQREIFLNQKDKKRFQKMLFIFNGNRSLQYRDVENIPLDKINRGEPLVSIASYCLMNNQIHLLITEKVEGGICKFVRRLLTGYSMYFNKNNNRTGCLFEGTYKSKHCADDDFLKCLILFINISPVKYIDYDWAKCGIIDLDASKKFLGTYFYSSYFDLCNKNREESIIIDKGVVPRYFKEKKFKDFFIDWINYRKFLPKNLSLLLF